MKLFHFVCEKRLKNWLLEKNGCFQSPPAPYASLNSQERLELARRQLDSSRSILATIRTMREQLGEQYADRLADNMTSCVTQ
jgi:hypothetical protein